MAVEESSVKTYKDILANLPGGLTQLEKAYKCVDTMMKEVRECMKSREQTRECEKLREFVCLQVEEYVAEWLRYQALWDLQAEMIYDKLSNDVNKWMKTLVEIRKSRATFDTQDTRKVRSQNQSGLR